MNWEEFLESLNRGKIIAIVGNDLSLVKDADGSLIQLDYYIAQELISRLGVGKEGDSLYDLALYHGRANIYQTIEIIFEELEEGLYGKRFYNKALEDLVQITDLNFFISTTFDAQLEKIINRKRSHQNNITINYSVDSSSDIPVRADNVVFNILGSISGQTQYALTEDEILEHFYSLAYNRNSQMLAKYLYEKIKGKTLLFIGCSYPDWFMRFIIRALASESYRRKRYFDYIADNSTHHDIKLKNFLSFFNSRIIVVEDEEQGIKNALAFVNQFYSKWTEINASRVPSQFDGSVFISYYHKDKEIAKGIRNSIRAEGITVWFDEDNLENGQHKPNIESEIKTCKIFIVIISGNVLDNPQSYSRQVEWSMAEKRFKFDEFYGKKTFTVLPVFIDDTPRTDQRLSDFMRSFTSFHYSDRERILEEITHILNPLVNQPSGV